MAGLKQALGGGVAKSTGVDDAHAIKMIAIAKRMTALYEKIAPQLASLAAEVEDISDVDYQEAIKIRKENLSPKVKAELKAVSGPVLDASKKLFTARGQLNQVNSASVHNTFGFFKNF